MDGVESVLREILISLRDNTRDLEYRNKTDVGLVLLWGNIQIPNDGSNVDRIAFRRAEEENLIQMGPTLDVVEEITPFWITQRGRWWLDHHA